MHIAYITYRLDLRAFTCIGCSLARYLLLEEREREIFFDEMFSLLSRAKSACRLRFVVSLAINFMWPLISVDSICINHPCHNVDHWYISWSIATTFLPDFSSVRGLFFSGFWELLHNGTKILRKKNITPYYRKWLALNEILQILLSTS